jgi:hypothetical protein
MKVVRDREEARWLPSRFRFAAFRLLALLVMTRVSPRERKGLVLVIDRDQNPIENYLLGAGAVMWGSVFIAGGLIPAVGVIAALLLCLPIALASYSALVVITGLVVEPVIVRAGAPIALARRINGLVHMALLLGAALYFASRPSWVRPVGIAFLLIVIFNVLAAVVMLLLKSRVTALDKEFGVGV